MSRNRILKPDRNDVQYISIGKGDCVIGSRAVISDNITIGENCMIGVGSVVTKNIPSGVVAYGNPCKVIRENDKWEI